MQLIQFAVRYYIDYNYYMDREFPVGKRFQYNAEAFYFMGKSLIHIPYSTFQSYLFHIDSRIYAQ